MLLSCFLPSTYAGNVDQAATRQCQSVEMATLLDSLFNFVVFNISFLPNYRVKYDDYISNVV